MRSEDSAHFLSAPLLIHPGSQEPPPLAFSFFAPCLFSPKCGQAQDSLSETAHSLEKGSISMAFAAEHGNVGNNSAHCINHSARWPIPGLATQQWFDNVTSPKSLAEIEALHVTWQKCNVSVACNTQSVQSTIFHRTDLAISVRKNYNILKATALAPRA